MRAEGSVSKEYLDAIQENSERDYVEISADWDDEEIGIAVKELRRKHPHPRFGGRRGKDKLRCVQCAVLHDDLGWTHGQIADRFGWSLRPAPSHGLPGYAARSEAVREYIAEGRRILSTIRRGASTGDSD